ncbi:MAG: transglutaminase family protein [Chitinophagales bacterium]|nr:transglutaminase family protein [Chitinophagales bacterium]
MEKYLEATRFIDSDHPDVISFAEKTVKNISEEREKAVAIYEAVRDTIWYDPYRIDLYPDNIKASIVLKRGSGYCVEKAITLTAVGRAAGLPVRLGFAIVKNHLASERFLNVLKTDRFVFHGYNEFLLDNRWIKCTPAFNIGLCEKYGVDVLGFNGKDDSIFHQFDKDGSKYMEYLHDYGTFADLPYDLFVSELRKYYGHLFEEGESSKHEGWYLKHPFSQPTTKPKD